MSRNPLRFPDRRVCKRATPAAVRNRHGFTLIELLLVLLIIGIAISIVGVNLGILETRSTDDEVQRLDRVLQFASERAAVSGYPIRMDFLADSYRFSVMDASGKWKLQFDPPELSEHRWASDVSLKQLSIDGQLQPANQLSILFGAEATPFELVVNAGKEGETRTIRGNSAGEVALVDPQQASSSSARAK